MKIACITNDGKTISRHFGRASHYLVVTVEDGKITQRDMREKMGHSHFVDSGRHHQQEEGRGMDAASHKKHKNMAEAISDCDVLICGGMGRGAYQSMQTFNIRPIVTQRTDIDETLQAYLDGELQDEIGMLH